MPHDQAQVGHSWKSSLPRGTIALWFSKTWIDELAFIGGWKQTQEGHVAPPTAWLAVHPGTAMVMDFAEGDCSALGTSQSWSDGSGWLLELMQLAIEARGTDSGTVPTVLAVPATPDPLHLGDSSITGCWGVPSLVDPIDWPALTHQGVIPPQVSLRGGAETAGERVEASASLICDFIELFAEPGVNEIQKTALKAGWLEVLGYPDESHQMSQSIEGRGTPRNGDYWHAIHHRREPDPGNAAYWFRRVSEHPLPTRLKTALSQLPGSAVAVTVGDIPKSWKHPEMLALFEEGQRASGSVQRDAKIWQWVEMAHLLTATATTHHWFSN
ncbi:MAG: hypothetical protein C0478_12705 [Planctomyces sp.]|nr:hypothetical protein [Planctomyces sp.]